MANYSLILDTKFKPFSYAEMLAPVAAATQAHQALEEEYGNLTTKANVWENMANEQTDPYAYKMYKTYSDDLEARAEQLMRYGLNASSRKGMLDMRARYSKEIVPIETAYKRREELAAEQRKAMLSNPTLFYQRDAASTSLDDFIKNPSLDYGAVYSGALLTQQAGQIASNLKTALTKKGDLKSLGLQFQYERLLQYGFTPNQIEKAITNPKEGDPVLTAIVDQVLESSGMAQWASPEQMRRARAFANQGLYNAIGKPEIQTFTDQAGLAKYKADLDDRNNARQYARQVAAQKAAEERQRLKMYNINPTSLYGTSEVSAKNKAILNELNKWKSVGYFNSKGQLTEKGWRALQYTPATRTGTRYDRYGHEIPIHKGGTGNYEFVNWAKKHGVTNTSDRYSVNILNKYYRDTMNGISSGQLVTGTPNIDVYRQSVRDEATQKYLLNRITAALAGGSIYPVGELSVTSKGVVTMGKGKGISAAQFRKLATDNPILYVANSPTTNNQLVELTDGSKYIMPKGIMDNISQANISEVNTRLANSGSPQESAVLLNQANSDLGTLLNYNEGTSISTNDGTITF